MRVVVMYWYYVCRTYDTVSCGTRISPLLLVVPASLVLLYIFLPLSF